MRIYILIAIAALWGDAVSRAIPFNQTSGSGSTGSAAGNPGVYAEPNRQLQIYASPSTNAAGGMTQDGLGMSTESDWTVSVDVRSSAPAASNDMISLGAYSLNPIDRETEGLSLHLSPEGSEPNGAMQGVDPAISGGIPLPELMLTNGTVRVSYQATNQVLEIAYATASTNQFEPLITKDTSDWPSMKSSGFVILLDAEPADEESAPGETFLDNLTVSLGTSPAWSGNRLPDGSMDLSATGGFYHAQGSTNTFGTAEHPSLSR